MHRHRFVAEQAPSVALGRAVALLMVVALSGCAASGPSSGTRATDPTSTAKVPPKALQVGEDLYQVPVGYDADGCLMYRLFSPTTMVTHAISYRSVDGGFTLRRKHALCQFGG